MNTAAHEVHVVVPASIDVMPTGGNVYDRRVCDGLTDAGWSVHEHRVAGADGLSEVIATVPDGGLVLVDGLVASTVPTILVPQSERLRLVVLMHMPLGQPETGGASARDGECRVLRSAAGVLTTSEWTRRWLLDHYPLRDDRIHVARPGVDTAEPAPGTSSGGELLCVASVTPAKGHDVLVEALAQLRDLGWRCVCVGDLTRDPGFVTQVRGLARDSGIADRVQLAGPRLGPALEASYATADVLVLATRVESYGMVVTEALARGLPAITTRAGGAPEALGELPDGRRPGLLVGPGDPGALAASLREWLLDEALRRDLRDAARARRASMTGWATTTRRVAAALTEVAA